MQNIAKNAQKLKKSERVKIILDVLNKQYPKTPVPLNHKDEFTLLVAVLLSAQCTDIRVNEVTPILFKKASNPKKMALLSQKEIYSIIKPCGLGPAKASNILKLSKMLIESHKGKVPKNFEELEQLPGVGHKTASVVMSQAFGYPAFAVDTHVHRCMYRWGLSSGKSVVQTEKDAKRLFPKDRWSKLHLQIIFYGREYCPAKNFNPNNCPITTIVGRRSLFK